MIKCLATLAELRSQSFRSLMDQINRMARGNSLQEYTTYSRVWEYPWVWSHLEALKGQSIAVLDIGSERSPFPWFLAMQGFRLILSDVSGRYWHVWRRASRELGVAVRRLVLDAQNLALPTASVDVYLSVSVVEHVPDKEKVIAEAARVLRPGGLLIMTFDICEPDMGMTFPEWNGRALTMSEFDDLFKSSCWFEPGLSELPWNTDDITGYLSWHRTTAPHHNYVTGAAVVRRNGRIWVESAVKNYLRAFQGKSRTTISVAIWYIFHVLGATRRKISRWMKSVARMAISLLVSPRILLLFGESFFWLLGFRERKRKMNLSQVKRLMVVRLDEIGDMVMTTPFLRELRRLLPDAWITLVVKPSIHNLVELCPYANEVLTYDWSAHRLFRPLQRHWRALRLAWKHLWSRRFDLAILPRWDADHYHGTYLMYFSGAPWRVGYSENVNASKKRLNRGFDRLLTHILGDNTLKHEVEHNLDVIRALGGQVHDDRLELWIGQDDEVFADEILKGHEVQIDELIVGFGPAGGNSPFKEWPASNFADLGRWLQKEYGARILIVGAPGEEALGKHIEDTVGSSVVNMVGKTTLRQMAALLKRCHFYIGNDAGPMHVAAAIDIPVVALFGSSCQHRFGPWGERRTLLWLGLPCSPCFQEDHSDRCRYCIFDQPHCILGITVEQVRQAVSRLLYEIKDLKVAAAMVRSLEARENRQSPKVRTE